MKKATQKATQKKESFASVNPQEIDIRKLAREIMDEIEKTGKAGQFIQYAYSYLNTIITYIWDDVLDTNEKKEQHILYVLNNLKYWKHPNANEYRAKLKAYLSTIES